jgi:hypothetical protein
MSDLPILCACGCGLPRRETSKYASDICAQKFRSGRYKAGLTKPSLKPCAGPGCSNQTMSRFCSPRCRNAEFRTRRDYHISSFGAHRKAVMVIDPMVSTPYFVSRAEFDRYAPDYRALGCSAEIDGQELLI